VLNAIGSVGESAESFNTGQRDGLVNDVSPIWESVLKGSGSVAETVVSFNAGEGDGLVSDASPMLERMPNAIGSQDESAKGDWSRAARDKPPA